MSSTHTKTVIALAVAAMLSLTSCASATSKAPSPAEPIIIETPEPSEASASDCVTTDSPEYEIRTTLAFSEMETPIAVGSPYNDDWDAVYEYDFNNDCIFEVTDEEHFVTHVFEAGKFLINVKIIPSNAEPVIFADEVEIFPKEALEFPDYDPTDPETRLDGGSVIPQGEGELKVTAEGLKDGEEFGVRFVSITEEEPFKAAAVAYSDPYPSSGTVTEVIIPIPEGLVPGEYYALILTDSYRYYQTTVSID